MSTKNAFKDYLALPFSESIEKDYAQALKAVEVEEFEPIGLQEILGEISSEVRHPSFPKKAGLFLSATMSRINSDRHLDLSSLTETKLGCLGAFFEKGVLTVKGDLGDYAGAYMASGKLIVEGDVADYAGIGMTGGTLNVKGLAENHLGHSMSGGEIVVGKNVLDFAGNRMTGGRISIKANAGYSIGYRMVGGLIAVRDLAWDLAGEEMMGGRIRIGGHLGHDLGLSMVGGELDISEKEKYAKRINASGGRLVVVAKDKKKK